MANDDSENTGKVDGADVLLNGTGLARARPNFVEAMALIEYTVGLLAEGMTPHEAARDLQKHKGMSRRTSYRYVANATQKMLAHDAGESVESRLARHKAQLRRRMRRAESMKRTGVTNGETYEYEAPDFKAANTAHAMLMALELPGAAAVTPGARTSAIVNASGDVLTDAELYELAANGRRAT